MKAINGFGFPVLRFNFRGTGLSEGEHANGVGEVDDVRAALDWLEREFRLPLIFAGFSFGAAVGLRAAFADERVRSLIALGLPVVPVDNRVYDFEFLRGCFTPKLFVSGARDQYAPTGKLEALVATFADPKKLVRVEAGDHFFEGRLREMRDAVEQWLKENNLGTTPPLRSERNLTLSIIFKHAGDRFRTFAAIRPYARNRSRNFRFSVEKCFHQRAFDRNLHCERRILRIGEDLHDLDSYNQIFHCLDWKSGAYHGGIPRGPDGQHAGRHRCHLR